jgi:acyl-CoA reductase-like NAD-dependent aldehyde dehydrogenase
VQRVYIEHAVYDEFAAAMTEAVRRLRVGDPLDGDTDVGSMVDADAAARVEGWIGEAVEGGASLLTGGRREGAVLEPTLLGAPPADAKVLVEEVFGDLVSLVPVDDFETAVRFVNSTRYGLQSGLFTNDLRRVFAAVRELDVGAVVVNGTSNYRLDHIPFGGVKDSGIGRESPRWLIEDFSIVKTVVFRGMSLWS